jgi:hypothetical protein
MEGRARWWGGGGGGGYMEEPAVGTAHFVEELR